MTQPLPKREVTHKHGAKGVVLYENERVVVVRVGDADVQVWPRHNLSSEKN